MSGSGREACRVSGSGRKAIPNVQEWSGDTPRCPGVVRSPSRVSGSIRKTLPNVLEWW